ncbi:MAG TPA: hypothetical protein VGO47_01385 [Chlamydiales bacterium]|jgi:hypothetical protein|nr:hypothetical protein [Chlamydiales bacterium]
MQQIKHFEKELKEYQASVGMNFWPAKLSFSHAKLEIGVTNATGHIIPTVSKLLELRQQCSKYCMETGRAFYHKVKTMLAELNVGFPGSYTVSGKFCLQLL